MPRVSATKPILTVCVNVRQAPFASCGGRGALALKASLEKAIAERGLPVELQTIKCLGKCDRGPNALLSPGNRWFFGIQDPAHLIKTLEELNAT